MQVAPYSIIGPDVTIGAGTVIASHVVIRDRLPLARTTIFQFASVGEDCQDKKQG